jgi:hypothetical protein
VEYEYAFNQEATSTQTDKAFLSKALHMNAVFSFGSKSSRTGGFSLRVKIFYILLFEKRSLPDINPPAIIPSVA